MSTIHLAVATLPGAIISAAHTFWKAGRHTSVPSLAHRKQRGTGGRETRFLFYIISLSPGGADEGYL